MKGNLMAKKETILQKNECRLLCPVCGEKVDHAVTMLSSVQGEELYFVPEPGELTECDHCLAMLEYGGTRSALALHVAPRQRVKQFHKFTREGSREPSLPELLEYVKRFRRMPERSSHACRLRKVATLQANPRQSSY
jgi:hypothetical protein